MPGPIFIRIGAERQEGVDIIFSVRLAGEYAREALKSGSTWKMTAVFQKGIYCQNRAGHLVFLGPAATGAGPLNALCEMPEGWNWQREGLHPDTPVHSDGKTLWVDRRFEFFFGSARPWRAADLSGRWDLQVIAERTPLLSEEAAGRRQPDGFGPLIPCLSEMDREPSCAPNPLIRVAWRRIRYLFKWLQSGFSLSPQDRPSGIDGDEIEGLIGLGPGLTPSGDDFLGGVMIALHSLGAKELAGKLGETVMARAPLRTHTVSLAHLTCAAHGEGSEALHDTISALGVRSDQRLIRCLDRIGSIGYTSGWDAAAGVFLVMKALISKRLSVSVIGKKRRQELKVFGNNPKRL